MPVCRECFTFKTKQMQDRLSMQNNIKELHFDDDTLISIEKSAESKDTMGSGLTLSDEKEHTLAEPAKSTTAFLE